MAPQPLLHIQRSENVSTTPTSFSKRYWERTNLKLAERQHRHHEAKLIVESKISALTKTQINQGVLYGTIASSVWDTACNSNASKVGNPYIQTDQIYIKVFSMADGHHTPASTVAKLHYLVRDPTRTVYMVLALADQSLLSSGKFAKPGYIYICDGKEFNIYDGRTVRIEVSEAVVLKLWH